MTAPLNSRSPLSTPSPLVEILMATFNGERFLAEQIDSILAQDYPEIILTVRDDGSTDGTREILDKYARQHPDRMQIISTQSGHLGATRGFLSLLQSAGAPYVMFADQDDVWLKDKVSRSIAQMRQLEAEHGTQHPFLLHSDLVVADEQLSVISPSFWKFQGLNPECDSLNRLLTQNIVTGCTMLMNRSLIDKIHPASPHAISHDWWIALVAAAFGSIAPLRESTMLYRQHGWNTIGAVKWGLVSNLSRGFGFSGRERMVQSVRQTLLQAQGFLETYGDQLPPGHAIAEFSNIVSQTPLGRIRFVLRHGFLKNGLTRNLGLFLALGTL